MTYRRLLAATAGLITAVGALVAGPITAATATSTAQSQPAWRAVQTGGAHTCGLKLNLALFCWGANGHGQLGIGSTAGQTKPSQVGRDRWVTVNPGLADTCAIRSDFTLWCWGANGNGQLGVGDTTDRTTPAQVGVDSGWRSVSAGTVHSCAIRLDGTLWCWGDNSRGELGTGNTTSTTTPVQVGTETTWTQVRVGTGSSCALQGSNDTLYCWGANGQGQLGLGDKDDRNTPAQVGGRWVKVATTGATTCGIREVSGGSETAGALFCWGSNNKGQLGIGDLDSRSRPTQVGTETDWLGLAPGYQHTCAVRSAQRLMYCWGWNKFGQLGAGDVKQRRLPTAVTGSGWKGASSGVAHGCSTTVQNTMFCWGSNSDGQLGVGDHNDRWVPTQL